MTIKNELNSIHMTATKNEASRKKSLGDLGEEFAIKILEDNGYEKVKNLNVITKKNYPFADIICEKDGKKIIVSVKARNKLQKNKSEINSRYKLGKKAYVKAEAAQQEHNAIAHWMAIQFDFNENTYSIYFGSLDELKGNTGILIKQCEKEIIGKTLAKDIPYKFESDLLSNQK